MTIDTVRHDEVFDHNEYTDTHITIVGAGAIGSRVFENLASTGLTNIAVIDFDEVESHNLANQLFTRNHIGMPKVDACHAWALDKCGADAANKMQFVNAAVTEATSLQTDIVICAVDSWDARRLVGTIARAAWADLLVELRMATTFIGCQMVELDNEAAYDTWLASLGVDGSDDYEKSSCGSSLTVGATAQTAGAVAAWSVMNYLKTGYVEKIIRVDTSPWMASKIAA